MRRIFILASSIIALSIVCQPAIAKRSFNQTASRNAEFTAADLDASNDLTLVELQTYFDAKIATRFSELDTDANKALSLDEFTVNENDRTLAFATEIFNLADNDASGDLNADEFAMQPSNGEIIMNFAQMDTDFDLLVTLAEYTTGKKGGAASFGKGGKNGGRSPSTHH